jgi:mono/diheme cytochrome c family protein
MIANILIMVVILAIAVLFFWLAVRSGRIRRGYVRWPARILSGLLGLVFAAVFVIASIGYVKLNARVSSPGSSEAVGGASIPVTSSSEMVALGQQRITLCTGCHSTQGKLPLDGSADNFLGGGGPPMGVLYAPNLTPGSVLKDWTDAEIARAIREGIDKDGRPLVVMPSQTFQNLSDEDIQVIIAGLRSQPAVDRQVPKRSLSPIAAAMLGAGVFSTSAQKPITAPVGEPSVGTVEYGKYITLAYGCQDCHGAEMTGMQGGGFGPPPGPDAKAIVKNWSEEDFLNLFREGKDPTGRVISKDNMPWNEYKSALNEDELRSVYLYLHGQ